MTLPISRRDGDAGSAAISWGPTINARPWVTQLRNDAEMISRHCAARRIGATLACLALIVIPAACTTSSTTAQGTPSYEVKAGVVQGLGQVLVDGTGMTLYLYEPDLAGRTTCKGFCAHEWPPLTLPAKVTQPKAGRGAREAMLGTTRRPDGALQLTYAGWPLYRWRGDYEPGQALGEGDDMGLWYAISPAGTAVIR